MREGFNAMTITPPSDQTAPPSDNYCGWCGKLMRYNVPRIGANGGFVHAETGKFECPPTGAAPTAQPEKRAEVTERHREIIRIILQDAEAREGGFDDNAQLLADSEADALADLRAIADRAHADLSAMSNKLAAETARADNVFAKYMDLTNRLNRDLAAETARAFEVEKEARSFASKLICCENDLKAATERAEQLERQQVVLTQQAMEGRDRAEAAATQLAAWQSQFGTSQLSHAIERLDKAERANIELRAEATELRKALSEICALYQSCREAHTIAKANFSGSFSVMNDTARAALARKTPAFQSENAGIEASMARKTGGGS